MAWRQYKYCPEKRKSIHPMATSAMLIHTLSGNRNAESVNTNINIYLVAILELLLVRFQLMQAETIDTVAIIVFTKIWTTFQNLSFKLA